MLKRLLPEYDTPFCIIDKFTEGRCRLFFVRVFSLCVSEFNTNNSLFLITNTSVEYISCDDKVRICNCLNEDRQESYLVLLVRILIIFFCNLKISLLA